jgi:hypothetical protein
MLSLGKKYVVCFFLYNNMYVRNSSVNLSSKSDSIVNGVN